MMISPQLARLDEHLQRLRLNTVRERLDPPGLAPSGTDGGVDKPLSDTVNSYTWRASQRSPLRAALECSGSRSLRLRLVC